MLIMKQDDRAGRPTLVHKPTGWCTNSQYIREQLYKLCARNHRRIRLESGRARAAAIYPKTES